MSKHTPAPWRIDNHFNGGDAIYIFPDKGGVAICAVMARDGEGRSNTRIQDMAEANAQLIEAAPTMLQALKDIEAILSDHPDIKIGNSTVHYVYHKTRAAIAEAERN